MATGSISSTGQFINIDALVTNAVRAQSNRVSAMQTQKSNLDTQVSSLGQAKSQISTLFDKFQAISKAASNYTVSGLASDSGLAVTGTQNGNYQIQVSQLASNQIMSSSAFNATGVLGFSGTLKIDKGSYDSSNNFTMNSDGEGNEITISSTDTLKDIQDKIRATGQVNVSIINGADGAHLAFSSMSAGTEQAVKISVSDTNNTGLSQLSYSQGNSPLYNEIAKAQDGIAVVNGITLNSKDNNFKGIDGLSFTATKIVGNQNISVKQDNTNVIKAINDFVSAYNSASQSLKNNTNLDTQIKNFGTTLRNTFSDTEYANSLSQLGLSFDKTGFLSFDQTKFTSLVSKPDQFSSLIKSQFSIDSKASKLFHRELDTQGVIDNATTNLSTQSQKIQKNLTSAQDVLTQQQAMYRNQYSKLDSYLSSLNDNSTTVGNLMDQFKKSSS